MVTFELFYNDGKIARYYYWPNGDKSKQPGEVTLDLSTGAIWVSKLAETDLKRIITAKELNDFLDVINQSRIENGEEPYDDYTDQDETSYFFADHVMITIQKSFNKGEILQHGSSAWY